MEDGWPSPRREYLGMRGCGREIEIKNPFSKKLEKGFFIGTQGDGYFADWAAATNSPAKAAFPRGLETFSRFLTSDSQKQK